MTRVGSQRHRKLKMLVVMKGREDKNEQKERGRPTEIQKRLKGKGDK